MKTIQYEIIPAVGAGTIPKNGNLLALFDSLPYAFSTFQIIPPREVLNDLFRAGILDAGMSGGAKWEAFDISESEYNELVSELKRRTEKPWRLISVPSWVKTRADWHIWTFEFEVGVPSETHYELLREEEKWATLKRNAQSSSDEIAVGKFHLKWIRASEALVKFITPYLERYREKKMEANK